MAKFRWHTLDKKPRDPGWADERPEPSGSGIAPRSPFSSRSKGRNIARSTGGWLFKGTGPTTTKKTKQTKKTKHSKPPRKTGATTPFDRYSLSTANAPADKAALKAKRKARKKERARRTQTQSGALRSKPKPPTLSPALDVEVAARPFPNQPRVAGLPLRATKVTEQAVTLAWGTAPEVKRWKAVCFDSEGKVVRKSALAGDVALVTLGGLSTAPQPFHIRVRGHDSLGRLIYQGLVEGVTLG